MTTPHRLPNGYRPRPPNGRPLHRVLPPRSVALLVALTLLLVALLLAARI
jgi:hypothetical protein